MKLMRYFVCIYLRRFKLNYKKYVIYGRKIKTISVQKKDYFEKQNGD